MTWAGSYPAGALPYGEIRQDAAQRARRLLAEGGSPAVELVERSRGAALLVAGSRRTHP